MGRTFQVDIQAGGITAMMTEGETILNTQSADNEVSIFVGDTVMTAENPNFEQEQTQTADISNTLDLNTLG
ncbi:MAG: hypothetical protein COA45_07135 [Zetaproteobacteria bacterium]|nr:MAG: hypothetical protein COA45_07135 [Zetaproteobacteria bacterium]